MSPDIWISLGTVFAGAGVALWLTIGPAMLGMFVLGWSISPSESRNSGRPTPATDRARQFGGP